MFLRSIIWLWKRNPDYELENIHNCLLLKELCVRLSNLSVKPVLTTIQLVIKAEFADADAETAEKRVTIKCFLVAKIVFFHTF